MSLAERNYTTMEREELAEVYSCKKFRHYLLGYKVIFHTDHNSLKYLVNKPDLSGRIARWILFLQEFNYEVVVKSGKANSNADFFLGRGVRNPSRIFPQSFRMSFRIYQMLRYFISTMKLIPSSKTLSTTWLGQNFQITLQERKKKFSNKRWLLTA
jgi:hypothetical protein